MMGNILNTKMFSQMFPPKPGFTEKDLPDLSGKVYIVTGSNTGVGKELAQMLYSKNAKVYIAARSQDKSLAAVSDIKTAFPSSTGELVFLKLDLSDLTTIKASAEEFLSKEKELHVLWNNAGVMDPPKGSKTTQGYELQLGVNNVGTWLFTHFLTPILVSTAGSAPKGSVRVVWVASSAAEMASPPGGVPLDNLDYHEDMAQMIKYAISKAGNYLHGTEFAKLYKEKNVVSVPLNPGNLASDLYRNQNPMFYWFLTKTVLWPNVYGAYTELFAGMSPDVTLERSGDWVVPWGRFMPTRKDLEDAAKNEAEGGTGHAEKFWKWTEEQVKPYL